MRISKFALAVAFVLTAILFAEVVAHADETDQATKLTFNKSIAIPRQALPVGNYPTQKEQKLAQDRQQTIVAQAAEAGN